MIRNIEAGEKGFERFRALFGVDAAEEQLEEEFVEQIQEPAEVPDGQGHAANAHADDDDDDSSSTTSSSSSSSNLSDSSWTTEDSFPLGN